MYPGGSLQDCREALQLATKSPNLFSTVGVHPTRCDEFVASGNAATHLDRLHALVKDGMSSGHVVAIGECGLDYDRLQHCIAEVQRPHFEMQIELAERTGLPLFLHSRAAGKDMLTTLRANRSRFMHAVVHSFDGTADEAADLVDLGLHIGLNGCSLKTAENLKVAATIPEHKLLLETYCPWCEIRPSHAGHAHVATRWPAVKKERFEEGKRVKNRTEPCHIWQVLEVVAAVRGVPISQLAHAVLENSKRVFMNSKTG